VGTWGPALLGHADREVIAAVGEAAARGLSFGAATRGEAEFAELLCAMVPGLRGGMVRLTCSGTEATMSALRVARGYTGRNKIVKMDGAYHGHADVLLVAAGSGAATLGLPGSAGVPPKVVEDTLLLPHNDADAFEALCAAQGEQIAAVIVEPVAGNMGCVPPAPGYLERLRELCTRHGILLVADEIQTGAGRTGKMWALEHWGVEPDILLVAKGIASGMPLGAMVARAEIMESWSIGAHGSTYGGNPVACAAALATIELLEGGLIENAAARGDQAMAGLRELLGRHPGTVIDVRGKGLMIGVEFAAPELAEAVQFACFERGLLVLECGVQTVRLCPPLVASASDVDTALRIFGDAVTAVAAEPARVALDAVAAGAMNDGEVAG
jgi:glutamate-1-semialdehyde-2,1-aminomutase